ncbi:GIDE domain-containing protein [Seonamhaeicola sp.]|uniref:GIDE domain-containing protein n=1 Tax=Seonamhaeicola sp. TaxID=1912245 RepID=UPI00261D52D4|nr:GIDE domain-containing protein [Seonamhaeicola sp.]
MILAADTQKYIIPVLIILVPIIIGLIAYYFSGKQVLLRQLSKFEFKSILQFRTNELTKITGKVLHVHEPFEVPFSKRKCVAYVIKIQQKVKTGKSSRWKTLVEKEDIQDFFIEDKGEVVMVKPTKSPRNFYSYLVEDKSISSGFLNDPTPEFEDVLNQYHIKSENFFGFNKTLRYSERILEVGETITAAGIAKWKSVQEPIEGYNYSKIAALESNETQKLIITDLPEARRANA